MTTGEQRATALRRANAQRARIAEVRRDMMAGRLTLADVMGDPPAELDGAMLVDVLRMMRSSVSARRSTPSLTVIGKQAVADGVNLLTPLGLASRRSREWVVEHGGYWTPQRERRVAA